MLSTETSINIKTLCIRSFWAGLLIVLAVGICSGPAPALDAEVVSLQYRNAAELLPVITPMLSATGRATADTRTNSLIVMDTAESIQRIRALLKRLDTAPVMVRIDVRFTEDRSTRQQEVAAEGSVSGNGWKVSTGGRKDDGIEVRVKDEQHKGAGTTATFVTTLSGSPAYVRVGTEIPYRQQWNALCRRYAGCLDAVVYRRIETGFLVTPTVTESRADLEITPHISDLESGDRIRFAGASTRISAPLGSWVAIGGGRQAVNDAFREILGTGKDDRTGALTMELRVERLDAPAGK